MSYRPSPRGYINSLGQGLPMRLNNGGQLSDPDSGCFSSSGNEAWFDQGPAGQLHPQLMSTMDSSSPLSSSGSSMMSHPPTSNSAASSSMIPNNNRLLAHTLENRKRVLQTLIREKADTLV